LIDLALCTLNGARQKIRNSSSWNGEKSYHKTDFQIYSLC